MKAITVKPVWAWAIIYAGKNIENRSRRTHIRGPVAIHASKNMSRSEYEKSKNLFPPRWRNKLPAYEDLPRGVIIGVAEIVDCVTESKSPWFMGDYGFVLKNRR
ncbi:MAG: ASCH domain-containing protein, partial [Acidobacteria bacterium]|nr:ASCH domain-containing protein [Acidobacteriota bacterium]